MGKRIKDIVHTYRNIRQNTQVFIQISQLLTNLNLNILEKLSLQSMKECTKKDNLLLKDLLKMEV
jgi:hypothetical protein